MMIGRILLHIKLLFGLINGIQEKDKIDGLREKWKKKTKRRGKNKKRIISKLSKIWYLF